MTTRENPKLQKNLNNQGGIRAKVENFDFQILWRLSIGVCDFSKKLLSR
jgi:hypothetical protein